MWRAAPRFAQRRRQSARAPHILERHKCRAFLARRRGHGGAVKRESFIRAGGLKTCWTKPQGTAVPQLWALQLGEKLQCPEKTGREGRGQELRAIAVPRR